MRLKSLVLGTCVAAAILGRDALRLSAQSGQSLTGTAAPKTAEQVYKNIQVLKAVPAEQLIPAMQFMAASLGVQCDFCHLENAFEKDDKETKQTARKMMRMMFAINQDNFEGHRELTCYACHRGAPRPVATPMIALEEERITAKEPAQKEKPDRVSLPNVDQILGKYLEAVGGARAEKVSTRIQKGTLTVGSQHFPVEVFAEFPARRLTTVHFPGGDSVTAISGEQGWLSAPGRALHDMSPSELDGGRIDAALFFPAGVKHLFKDLHLERQEQIHGQAVYVVAGRRETLPPVELYFDQQSGLLVRVLRFVETPLGRNPIQIDYADYRDDAGVKTPLRWTIARPNGQFTIQIEHMQSNVPIEDDKFRKPPVGAASESKPGPS